MKYEITDPERVCPECGKDFTATTPMQRFCIPAHKAAFHNRQAGRGKVAVSILQTWRWRTKDVSAEDMAFAYKELCGLAGVYNREDKLAGRKPYVPTARRREVGWLAVDEI